MVVLSVCGVICGCSAGMVERGGSGGTGSGDNELFESASELLAGFSDGLFSFFANMIVPDLFRCDGARSDVR